jgi:hypothetical protein
MRVRVPESRSKQFPKNSLISVKLVKKVFSLVLTPLDDDGADGD